MLSWPQKDPSENLDYQIDFTKWLGGDTIQSQVVTADGVTKGAVSESGGVVTVWLSGGQAGTTGRVTVTVTTVGGRTVERSASIYIDDL